jgi:hypothetical protein
MPVPARRRAPRAGGPLALALALALNAPVSAQTPPDPGTPRAAPGVAPPRPTPGESQSRALRERLLQLAFQEADRDHNKQLSREEAASLPGLAERFEQVDSDRNGQLSGEEFRAADRP